MEDRNESIGAMEPARIRDDAPGRHALVDLALDLASKAAALSRGLPADLVSGLAEVVRAMNCYYSNLIEGHDTHPVDIERALRRDYSQDPQQRSLQLEARAHIEVQRWIDGGGLGNDAATRRGILDIHRRFCELLPEDLLVAGNPTTGERARVTPGGLRDRDVIVGRHIPVSPGAVSRFLDRFEAVHTRLGRTDRIIATATAHHRLLWIHPFLDGNGRVARLMSHAMLRSTLAGGALWSVGRGLARREADYKGLLAQCDLPRRHDADGRGPLSEEALVRFAKFFLETCIDQVEFMAGVLEPEGLRARILFWADEEIRAGRLPPQAATVLEAVLYRGELDRGLVPDLVGVGSRQGRRITGALMRRGVLASETSRAPLRLAFPAVEVARWLPGLFTR